MSRSMRPRSSQWWTSSVARKRFRSCQTPNRPNHGYDRDRLVSGNLLGVAALPSLGGSGTSAAPFELGNGDSGGGPRLHLDERGKSGDGISTQAHRRSEKACYDHIFLCNSRIWLWLVLVIIIFDAIMGVSRQRRKTVPSPYSCPTACTVLIGAH